MKQKTPIIIDEKMTELPQPPKLAYLTNKAGAFANPLEADIDAWLKIGWYRV